MSECLVSKGLGLVLNQKWKVIMIVLCSGEPCITSHDRNA
jgi:hypothetical protein